MIEDVEERGEAAVLGARPFQNQFAVDVGQHALGARHPHEVDHHLGGRILPQFQFLDFAGGKTESWIDVKVHRLIFGAEEVADGAPVAHHALQQRHRLEELE